jgi:hypothetical protein
MAWSETDEGISVHRYLRTAIYYVSGFFEDL